MTIRARIIRARTCSFFTVLLIASACGDGGDEEGAGGMAADVGAPTADAAAAGGAATEDAAAAGGAATEDAAAPDVGGAGGAMDGGSPPAPAICAFHAAGAAAISGRAFGAWVDRGYDIHIPPGYDCTVPAAVVLNIHGGGGSAEGVVRATCEGGLALDPDLDSPHCLNHLADRENFVVASPNGTRIDARGRTYCAGGGANGYAFIAATACERNVDDVAYIGELLDDLQGIINVDRRRVFSTGLSNGGALSHRLACELSDRIAAIASVGGLNQHGASTPEACAPGRPVPVLMLHGTGDLCWPYEAQPPGSGMPAALGCHGADVEGGLVASGPQSEALWAANNGCGDATETVLPDVDPQDGSTITRIVYSGCDGNGDVEMYRIDGGGHTWPGGWQYRRPALIGPTNRDVVATAVVWAFFAAHPMP